MNEESNTLHPWIEPETEARLTALVLGEASDFERDELERLVAERPELALYRKRLEAMHRLLREVATGESAAEQREWKLAPERRAALLARLRGEGKAEETIVVMPQPKRRLPWGMVIRIAACVAVVALMLVMFFVPAGENIMSSSDYYLAEAAKDAPVDRWGDDDFLRTESEALSTPRVNSPKYAGMPSSGAGNSSAGAPLEQPAVGLSDSSRSQFSMAGTTKAFIQLESRVEADRDEFALGQTSAPDGGISRPKAEVALVDEGFGVVAGDRMEVRWKEALDQSAAATAADKPVEEGRSAGRRELDGAERLTLGGVAESKAEPEVLAKEKQLADSADGTEGRSELYRFGNVRSDSGPTNAPAPAAAAPAPVAVSQPQTVAAAPMSGPEKPGEPAPVALSQEMLSQEMQPKRSLSVEQEVLGEVTKFKGFANLAKQSEAGKQAPSAGEPKHFFDAYDAEGDKTAAGRGLREDLGTVGAANQAPGKDHEPNRALHLGLERSELADAPEDFDQLQRLAEVDPSLQDILALTPQVGRKMAQSKGGFAGNGGMIEIEELSETEDRVLSRTGEDGGGAVAISRGEFQGPISSLAAVDFIGKAEESSTRWRRAQPLPALDETSPSAEPFSTFSLHVSDVSFQLAKSSLASGKWPEAEKIRIEEFVNAFDYGDPVPSMGERVACRIDQGGHPFLQQRNLVRIALRTAEAGRSSGTPLRLTLLLDSSGSMERPDRRATLTRAVATLAGLLGENDRITLVSFARQPRLVADAVAGNEAMKLAETVAALPSEGGTNLEAALELAFEKAREHQEANAQNRIVLLTDGAANLGDAKAESLGARVEMMRDAGIAFDAAGFGAEGLNDEILEALTRKGDGRYYLLDRPEDAGEAFAEQIAGALRPAAKNVKVQVEFNPDRVKSYKLLGFEKHRLATEDFRNDAVDAAELAAAEAGVAVYQVEPDPAGEGDLGSVSVRFRDLESGEMVERRWALPHLATAPAADQGGGATHLAIVASQFAAKLAGGPLGDVVDLGELARLAATLPDSPRVNELRTMIEQARGLEGASTSF
ncbi:MAG: von Willebrand factor type A domain-containing protein [Verrucomicrobiales bacterium]|nr:von Willebrand factor type A domain-containing protein [Verrucomicrobiales bacterium]